MARRQHVLIDDIPDGDEITPSNESFDFLTRTSASSKIVCDTALAPLTPPAAEGAFRIESLASEICDLRDYESQVLMGASFDLWIPAQPAVITTVSQIRTLTVGAFTGRSELSLVVAPDATTTVAAGSNGATLTGAVVGHGDFSIGTGVLDVANTNTLFFAPASVSQPATITVDSTGVDYVLTYTGKTTGTFTGCQWISGSGTVATGGVVLQEASIRLGLPASYPHVTSIPYPVAAWFRIEYFALMGTTTSDGQILFGMFLDPAGTVPDASYSNLAANVGVQSERTQYEQVAYGRCSPTSTDVTNIQLRHVQTITGADVGAIGTHVWVEPEPPDPEPEPPVDPPTNAGRLFYHVFDGTNLR
jgi:hypothetical protein